MYGPLLTEEHRVKTSEERNMGMRDEAKKLELRVGSDSKITMSLIIHIVHNIHVD
jgi:hypothetical protein